MKESFGADTYTPRAVEVAYNKEKNVNFPHMTTITAFVTGDETNDGDDDLRPFGVLVNALVTPSGSAVGTSGDSLRVEATASTVPFASISFSPCIAFSCTASWTG